MNKTLTMLVILASIIQFQSCSTTKKNEVINREVNEETVEVYDDANTISNFEKGKSIYENQCTLCHEAKNIEDFSMEQWQEIVPDMVAKVNKKVRTEEIDPDEERILFHYIEKVHP